MKRKRNKYQFKWWHGVLGLIGLSMVLGTVRSMHSPPSQTFTTRVYPFGYGQYRWEVIDASGRTVDSGVTMWESDARAAAAAWIESQMQRNPQIAMEPLKDWKRPTRLATPPWDGYRSWQDKWDYLTR